MSGDDEKRPTVLSDEFPALGEIDPRLVWRRLGNIEKNTGENLAVSKRTESAVSGLSDRMTHVETDVHALTARVDHIERAITAPRPTLLQRWLARWRRPMVVGMLVGMLLGAGGLAVALFTFARSS